MEWLKKFFSGKGAPIEVDEHLDSEKPESKKPERKRIGRRKLTFNARALTTTEDRPKDANRTWFAVDPGVFYPATIARIQEVLAANVYPEELNDPATNSKIDSRSAGQIILNDVNSVSEESWANALEHRQSFDSIKDAQKVATRAFALDVARRWFTQALHVQTGGDGTPMGLHILDNPKYKS